LGDDSLKEKQMEAIKCPKCGKSHYMIRGNRQTCLYNPMVVGANGNLLMNDSNIYMTDCECLECGEKFEVDSRYGKTTVMDCGSANPQMIPEDFSRTAFINKPMTAELAIGAALKADQICINLDRLGANPDEKFTLVLEGKEYSFTNFDDFKKRLGEFLKMK
jgi:Zn finger protein HypA/HybF involved in hydrogenase expression